MCKEKATGQIFAMKIRNKDMVVAEDDIDYILAEKRVLHTLQTSTHPFLLVCHYAVFLVIYHSLSCAQSLKYSFQTSDRLFLVTQYVRGGDLLFHLQREGVFTENRARFYGAEITLGVQHLHQLGVIHRSISVGIVCMLCLK